MRTLWLLSLIFLIAACSTPVTVDYDDAVDFARLRTFAQLPPPPTQTGDPRIDNPLLVKRVQAALREVLQARGYREVSQDPDFYVSFQLGLKQGVESSGGVTFGFGTYGGHGGIGMAYGYPGYDVSTYEEGVLTVDILRGSDKTLIWRGTASKRLSESGSKRPDEARREIREIVQTILDRFPPGRPAVR